VEDQYYPRSHVPSGAVITNAEELLRFASMHLEDGRFEGQQLLSPGSARSMRQPQIESGDFADFWGIGWDIRDIAGVRLFGHSGSTNGYQSQLTLSPEYGFALCIWTNSGRGSLAINPIEEWVLERELGLVKPTPETVELPVAQLERVTGRYVNPRGEVHVLAKDSALRARMWSRDDNDDEMTELPEAVAEALSPDRFAVLEGIFKGEVMNFFPRGAERPTFLRRHGRLFERVE
jgi:CubicO group peptidase (beta-lactamase class C family)